MWKSHLGSQATYRALMEVFVRAGRMDCTKSVVEILKEGAEMTDIPAGTCRPTNQASSVTYVINGIGNMHP